MKFTSTVAAVVTVLVTSLFIVSCAPDQDSPLNNPALSVNQPTSTANPTVDAEGVTHEPGYVHAPIVGCDTLELELINSLYGSAWPMGKVNIIQGTHDLNFQIKPTAGLSVKSVQMWEDELLASIPIAKDGSPDWTSFGYNVNLPVGTNQHVITLAREDFMYCQAYSIHVVLAMYDGNGNELATFDAWQSGTDAFGTGQALEMCVPRCGWGITTY